MGRPSCSSVQSRPPSAASTSPSRMWTCRPTARAVGRWSPVIMTTRIPARWHSSTLRGTIARGGSEMPQRLRKQRPEGRSRAARRSSAVEACIDSTSCWVSGRTARRMLRSARCESSSLRLRSAARPSSESGRSPDTSSTLPSPFKATPATWLTFGRILSGAPFTTATCVAPSGNCKTSSRRLGGSRCTVAIILRLGLKGTSSSATRGCVTCSSSGPRPSSSHRPPFAAATFRAPSVMLPWVLHHPVLRSQQRVVS
mmetsp:Transcript_67702/g.198151  ORF Transcript_67702/g.198151 Transcript_67702/m.198151 type:complete len:256 (-) Transcript_67702:1492-2259(-)